MMQPVDFDGPLAAALADFLAFKHMQGYTYRTQAGSLRLFDRFVAERDCPGGILHGGVFRRYQASISHLSPGTREGYLSAVRVFSRHLHALRAESVVMPTGMEPRHIRPVRFRHIAPAQVRMLMDAAAGLRMRHPIGPDAVRFLIGLLYSTGLRISEALKLNLGDVDLRCGTLYVRRSKFAKDRLVAVTQSVREAVEAWLKRLSRHAPTGSSDPLLPGGRQGRLTYPQSRSAFRTLCSRCGLDGDPPARLHDLRHNFACRCIARWRETAEDVPALLPVLANAMGHVSVLSTQFYVHLDAAELQPASTRFRNYFIRNKEQAS